MTPERARPMWMWRYEEARQTFQHMKRRWKSGLLHFCVPQAELTFCAGDIIAVFGEIDEDGFYYVSKAVF